VTRDTLLRRRQQFGAVLSDDVATGLPPCSMGLSSRMRRELPRSNTGEEE